MCGLIRVGDATSVFERVIRGVEVRDILEKKRYDLPSGNRYTNTGAVGICFLTPI